MNVNAIGVLFVCIGLGATASARAQEFDAAPGSDLFQPIPPADASTAIALGERLPSPSPDGAQARADSHVEDLFSIEYGKLLLADGADIATSPLHWDGHEWRELGYVSLGLAVTIAAIDKPVRDAVQRNRTSGGDRFLKDIEPFGQKRYTIPLLAGFYVYGSVADSPQAKATALDGVAVSFIANIVTSTFKGVFGRARPNTGHGAHYWRPFQGGTSFPSGHATQAFAVASVIADHYEESPWVAYVSYGTASLVALARIDHDAHWTSDVIAGGLIGSFIGKEIVRFNSQHRAEHAAWVPEMGTDGQQLTLNWAW